MNEDLAFPSPGTYIAISIEDISIENYEVYEDDGGVIIANHGTTSRPVYGYYAYLANDDYAVNGVNKLMMKDYVTGSDQYSMPTSGTIYINANYGLTGDTDNITSVTDGYTAYTLFD